MDFHAVYEMMQKLQKRATTAQSDSAFAIKRIRPAL